MAQSEQALPARSAFANAATSHVRWIICGLLFYATTVNYIDRMVLGILKPTIAAQLHWSDAQYGFITSAFQFGYAVMMPIAGRLLDWLGLRIGYSVAAVVWGGCSMLHALAGNAFQFGLARLGLGLGEAANFPAAIKALAEWFPQQERALATGIFNSGSNIGAVAAPLLVPVLYAKFGWQSAFLCTGSLSLSWVIFWSIYYRRPDQHPRVSEGELALIHKGQTRTVEVRVSYVALLRTRAMWAFLLGKLLTDPVWWFYLFWIPGFLALKYHVDLVHIGPPLVTIYLAADVGSIGGGWLSSALIKRGWEAAKARKAAMLICALSVLAIMFVPAAHGDLWLTVALIAIAASAHQGWSANLYNVAADNFPRSTVASVVGLGGFGGAIGGMLVQPVVGLWLDVSRQRYAPLFWIAGGMYLIALLVIHILIPRFPATNSAGEAV